MPQYMNLLCEIGRLAVQTGPRLLPVFAILLTFAALARAAAPEFVLMCGLAAKRAARFFKALYDEFGDWSQAAGAYHPRTPTYADRHSARFGNIGTQLSLVTTVAALPSRRRKWTLSGPLPLPLASLHSPPPLFAQGTASRGSLVPLVGNGGAKPLILLQ